MISVARETGRNYLAWMVASDSGRWMNSKKVKESACLRSVIAFDTVRLTSRMSESDGWPPREPPEARR